MIATENVSFTVTYDSDKLPDPKQAFANIYGYQPKVSDQDGNLIDNPETKKGFMKRKLGEFALGVMIQDESTRRRARADSDLKADCATASVG